MQRDLRDADHLTTCMEARVNLVTTEKARELSHLNNRLYECVLPEEARPEQDNVISHMMVDCQRVRRLYAHDPGFAFARP